MDSRLIVPARVRNGLSQSEVMNLMAGLERVTDEQLAMLLSATLGEVLDRHGPQKCLHSVRLVLESLEGARSLVA
jgi:hypothetical protein